MKKKIRMFRFWLWTRKMLFKLKMIEIRWKITISLHTLRTGLVFGYHAAKWLRKYNVTTAGEWIEIWNEYFSDHLMNEPKDPYELLESFKTWYITKVWAA